MFASLLVANRGEIAVRIFRTARAMGVKCIAVYSDADAKAKHVREADVALRIGPPPARESYLNGEAILAAAERSGAEAIHPGYGFLSENAEFAEAVVAAGLIWVGPQPSAIRAMGLKHEARALAEAAGVPVLPGYGGDDQSEAALKRAAAAIGWPVLIKAVAGGGGRGIREVRAASEFSAALASARREAAAAFGDDRVLIEKLVERPRHIEVQVFGDAHGDLVHLFERDCSLQRRRQKVIEEAPAPGMTENVRAAMTGAALKLARVVEYQNAGTVEFIVDGAGPLRPDGFWFMEMNTRLQVEHPVTEAITGLDLVEWQLRVAAGETLPKTQKQLQINGHAIEARLCAEDPSQEFRPSIGPIQAFEFDAEYFGARMDCGYDAGDEVAASYDNLIAKAIGAGEDRAAALELLDDCLSNTFLIGPTTNLGFLLRCVRHPQFAAGGVDTGFIAANLDALTSKTASKEKAARAFLARDPHDPERHTPWRADGWRLNGDATMRAALTVDGEEFAVDLGAHVDYDAHYSYVEGDTLLTVDGDVFRVARQGEGAGVEDAAVGDTIAAPLPGKIVAVHARIGQAVKRGDPLVTIEAMKMEHALKAPRDGVVAELAAVEGAQVKEGQVLARLDAAAAAP